MSNVSKILEMDNYPVYDGVVQPGPAGEAGSFCQRFFNYRNKFDPFTLLKTFDPGWHPNFYNSKKIAHIHDKNVHALKHYADHPLVHISMLRSFLGFSAVSRDEELAAIANFKDIDPEKLETEKLTAIKETLENARTAITDTPDVIDLMKGLSFFETEAPE